ncbi:MAG: hypothetical protein AABZ80_13490 [Gemmatimonadota bacterium]
MAGKKPYTSQSLPKGLTVADRKAMRIINKWARAMRTWGRDVRNAVGHKGSGSPAHIVGDPPHPPFKR